MPGLPQIHYLWVGPPTKDNPNALPGHDIAGPISLCEEFKKDIYVEKNVINFWCLKKYYEYYQKFFEGQHIQIEVCAIESLIEEKESKTSDDRGRVALAGNLARLLGNESSMEEIIDFKDRFSLFLLMKKPGYVFDTNVFPKRGFRLNLPSQEGFVTARSGYTGLNDFYLMYSPRNNEWLQTALARRLKYPYHVPGEMTFHGLSIPCLDLESLGVQKVSYKSYIKSNLPGFFRLLDLDFETFKEHCKYADLNLQIPCPFSKRAISECGLCWIGEGIDLTPEVIKSRSFSTNYTYVAGYNPEPRIYFYDKTKDRVVLVDNELSSIYTDYFPCSGEDGKSVLKLATPETLDCLIQYFNAHPPVLVNVEGGTLLHHAVMDNDIKKVGWLIEMGARLDLKALYQIHPSESDINYEYTPIQLAKFLKLNAIVDLLQKSAKPTIPVDSKSPERPAPVVIVAETKNEAELCKIYVSKLVALLRKEGHLAEAKLIDPILEKATAVEINFSSEEAKDEESIRAVKELLTIVDEQLKLAQSYPPTSVLFKKFSPFIKMHESFMSALAAETPNVHKFISTLMTVPALERRTP